MTRRFYVDGVEQTDTSARLVGPVEGLTCAADGTYSTSRWAVKDRTGSLSYAQLQTWAVEEDTATDPRLFTGLTYGITVTRGPFQTGAKREYEFEVDDLNAYLHMGTMPQGGPPTGGNRPAESFDTRIAWLLSTPGMAGIVYDNGLVASRPGFMYDESDYRKSYHDDVLQDMARGWIFFLYWDASAPSGEEVSLFFDLPTAAVNTSTLSISTVAADCGKVDDPATTVYPVASDPPPTLTRSGAQMYCKIDYTFIGGQNIVRHSATTHALLFGSNPDIHRTAVISTDKVGKLTTAEAQCALFLVNHGTQIDEITCRVKVPSTKVSLINAGMRLPIRFAQFPDYTGTGLYSRVTRKTLPRMESTNGYDDIDLTLSTKGIKAIGGGDPGAFPHNPVTPPAHYYSGTLNCSTVSHGADCYDVDVASAVYLPGVTYNYSITLTGDWTDLGSSFYVVDAADHSIVLFQLLPVTTSPQTGTFTTGIFGGLMSAEIAMLHSDLGDKVIEGTFYVDPVGWVVPVADPPSPAEPVPPEFVANGDGSTTLFHTLYPYAPGSLKVWVDGHPILLGLTETDPATGAFTIDFAPLPAQGDTAAEKVTAAYQGAAGASTTIIGFGARTIEVSA